MDLDLFTIHLLDLLSIMHFSFESFSFLSLIKPRCPRNQLTPVNNEARLSDRQTSWAELQLIYSSLDIQDRMCLDIAKYNQIPTKFRMKM